MERSISRRDVVRQGMLAGAAALALNETSGAEAGVAAAKAAEPASRPGRWPISLNTSTLRGQKLTLVELVEIAAKAGYQGIEPWHDELGRHVEAGGSLKDVGKRLKDLGLKVTGGIAFFEWLVDDAGKRARGLEEAKRLLERFAQIGASHLASPPLGDVKDVKLVDAAERYRALLEAAEGSGVVPAAEIWGGAGNLFRLGQAVGVAIEAHHPKACVLPDVYHLHRGGSGLGGVRKVNPELIAGFHLNDYPADPPAERVKDSDRVYPGDGVAPLAQLFRDLRDIGYRGAVSIELFNPEYYKQDPLHVAQTALEKTRRVMDEAMP